MQQLQNTIRKFGVQRLGPTTAEIQAQIKAITELDRLARMIEQVLTVVSWEELLATP